MRDFAPIAVIGSTPQLLVLHPSLPPRTFREFTAFVKANAKTLSYGSGGFGSTPHMAGELFNTSLKVRVAHVPYKGENPGVVDLLGGQIPYMFSNFPVVFPHVQAGKLRALAITSPQRSPLAPEYPTVAESGIPGFDTATWSGLYVPVGDAARPREAHQRRHRENRARAGLQEAHARAGHRPERRRHAGEARGVSQSRVRALGQGDPGSGREGGISAIIPA